MLEALSFKPYMQKEVTLYSKFHTLTDLSKEVEATIDWAEGWN